MEQGVNEFGVEHIIIDNLQFLLGTSGNVYEERFQRQDRFVQKLRSFASYKRAHLTIVVHPRKEDFDRHLSISSLYGGGKIAQEADNILLLQTENNTAYPKKFLQLSDALPGVRCGSKDEKEKADEASWLTKFHVYVFAVEELLNK
ncbi:unnamed protein product [Echinostoma caproni]|uniref:SF4 helicase domain-containing protein n=1 Tax=Echinostoma caproni TaxID=27848 RepID=A0A183B5S2_9TREM|nr:unnamed protein product [Echinostoma caproni]